MNTALYCVWILPYSHHILPYLHLLMLWSRAHFFRMTSADYMLNCRLSSTAPPQYLSTSSFSAALKQPEAGLLCHHTVYTAVVKHKAFSWLSYLGREQPRFHCSHRIWKWQSKSRVPDSEPSLCSTQCSWIRMKEGWNFLFKGICEPGLWWSLPCTQLSQTKNIWDS